MYIIITLLVVFMTYYVIGGISFAGFYLLEMFNLVDQNIVFTFQNALAISEYVTIALLFTVIIGFIFNSLGIIDINAVKRKIVKKA